MPRLLTRPVPMHVLVDCLQRCPHVTIEMRFATCDLIPDNHGLSPKTTLTTTTTTTLTPRSDWRRYAAPRSRADLIWSIVLCARRCSDQLPRNKPVLRDTGG